MSKHKCRIVCQGFLQVRGRDFDETFAPTPRPATIKMLLAHATLHNRHLYTLDIKAAYLNAEVDSRFQGKIYIKFPAGVYGESPRLARLEGNLYGLRQGGNRWWLENKATLVNKLGMTVSPSEPCLYLL